MAQRKLQLVSKLMTANALYINFCSASAETSSKIRVPLGDVLHRPCYFC